MPADINRQPQGLLGFLDIKNLGRNPSPLSDGLAATLPLTDWYLETAAEYLTEGNLEIAGPALGYNRWTQAAQNLVVPQNQWWRVHEYSCLTLFDIGGGSAGCTDVSISLTYEMPMPIFTGSGSTGQAIDLPTITSGPAQGFVVGAGKPAFTLAKPIWVPPGAIFGYQLTGINPIAGQCRVAFTIRFTRIRV